MKIKDKKELFTKNISELKKLLDEAIKAVASLKFDHQQNKLKDTRSIFNKRKEVAILYSVLNFKKGIDEVKEEAGKVVEKVEKKIKAKEVVKS